MQAHRIGEIADSFFLTKDEKPYNKMASADIVYRLLNFKSSQN